MTTTTRPRTRRSPAALATVLASVGASWAMCAWALLLSGSVTAWIVGLSAVVACAALFVLHLRATPRAGLRGLGRAAGGLAALVAVGSILLKTGWLPDHPGWCRFFMSSLLLAVGGAASWGWYRRGWFGLPVGEEPAEAPAKVPLEPTEVLDATPHPDHVEEEAAPEEPERMDSRRFATSA